MRTFFSLFSECCALPYIFRVNHLFDDLHLILSVKDLSSFLANYPVCLCVNMDDDDDDMEVHHVMF